MKSKKDFSLDLTSKIEKLPYKTTTSSFLSKEKLIQYEK